MKKQSSSWTLFSGNSKVVTSVHYRLSTYLRRLEMETGIVKTSLGDLGAMLSAKTLKKRKVIKL